MSGRRRADPNTPAVAASPVPVTRCPPAYVAPVQGAEPIPELRERNDPKKSRSLWGFGKAKRHRNGNTATKARKVALAQATQGDVA